MDWESVLKRSAIYAGLTTVGRWARNSTVQRLVGDSTAIGAIVLVFLVLSISRVLISNMDTTIRFLSFTVLSLITGIIAWRVLEPPSNRQFHRFDGRCREDDQQVHERDSVSDRRPEVRVDHPVPDDAREVDDDD